MAAFSDYFAEQLSKLHQVLQNLPPRPSLFLTGAFFLSSFRCFSGMSNIWGLKGFSPKAPATCAGTVRRHILTLVQEDP